jgi:hypothetical protein
MSRYIDADALNIDFYDEYETEDDEYTYRYVSEHQIDTAPSIDIVHCQDCKHWVYNFNGCSRNPCAEPWYAEDFCSYGEREGE